MNPEPLPVPPPPEAPPADPVFWGWFDIALALAFVLPTMILAAILIMVPFWGITGHGPDMLQVSMPAQLLGYALWLFCLAGLFKWRYRRPLWRSLGFAMPAGPLRFIALGPVLAIGVGLLGALLRTPELKMPLMEQLLADPVQRVFLVVFGVTFGPVCEELFFRGLVLPVAVRSLGLAAAVVLTSAPFALMHGPQYSWSWQHLTLLTLVGGILAALRLRSGSTAAATLTHCAYNLTMFGGYFLNGRNH